jgi:5-methylcytosine-specific restriction protein A
MTRLTALPPRLAKADTRRIKPDPKRADPELLSAAHRWWRETVINRAGHRCEWVENGRRCTRGDRLFADHIVERKDGGDPLDPSNGQALCGKHHTLKTTNERARRR